MVSDVQSKRPEELKNVGPLYLSVIDRPRNQNVWYKGQRMGVNNIAKIVKEIVKDSPLATNSKKYTNNTIRKSTVKKLRACGIPKEDIRTVTGHKHTDSLDAYDSGDENVLYGLSTTLSKEPESNNVPTFASNPWIPLTKQSSSDQTTSVEHKSATYGDIYGNVYNISVSNCDKVYLPTNTSHVEVSSPFKEKRLKKKIWTLIFGDNYCF